MHFKSRNNFILNNNLNLPHIDKIYSMNYDIVYDLLILICLSYSFILI
jgi:hypothetical protein